MPIDENLKARLQRLLDDSTDLARGDKNDQCIDPTQMQACSAWLTAAQNIVHLIFTEPNAPYRSTADRIVTREFGYTIHHSVGELAAVLTALQNDVDLGFLASVADRARAETLKDERLRFEGQRIHAPIT